MFQVATWDLLDVPFIERGGKSINYGNKRAPSINWRPAQLGVTW